MNQPTLFDVQPEPAKRKPLKIPARHTAIFACLQSAGEHGMTSMELDSALQARGLYSTNVARHISELSTRYGVPWNKIVNHYVGRSDNGAVITKWTYTP